MLLVVVKRKRLRKECEGCYECEEARKVGGK